MQFDRVLNCRCALLFLADASQNQPGLGHPGNLAIRTTHKQSLVRIEEVITSRFCHSRNLIFVCDCVLLRSDIAREFYGTLVRIEKYAMHGGGSVQHVVPIDENPQVARIYE
jgi:hypothetical protein